MYYVTIIPKLLIASTLLVLLHKARQGPVCFLLGSLISRGREGQTFRIFVEMEYSAQPLYNQR